MALDATVLATAIKNAMQAAFGPSPPTSESTANYQKLGDVVANAVIDHFKASAVVTVGAATGTIS